MQKKVIPLIAAAVLLGALAVTIQTRDRLEKFTRTEFLMDTIVESTVFAHDESLAQNALGKAYREMARLESMLSRHHATSEVARINLAAGREPVAVSQETLLLVDRALEFGELTGGAFDVTVAPLLDLWRFAEGGGQVPPQKSLQTVLKMVDYSQIALDRATRSVFLRHSGAAIDLGGIAKGFVVDQAADVLRANGVLTASVDAGGDIRLIGAKPDGSPWRIGVRHPRERDRIIAVLELRDSAVVTSGDYERYFMLDGARYHHLLDPATGHPARGLASVTVVAPEAVTADALSTAVFVLGRERGLALIESLPGTAALLVTEELEVVYSSGLAGKVTVTP